MGKRNIVKKHKQGSPRVKQTPLTQPQPCSRSNSDPSTGGAPPLPLVDYEFFRPEQFFTPGRQSEAVWTGARRLLFVVLREAFHTFFYYRDSHSIRGKRLFREVQEWFASTDPEWLYSFENICAHLSLDPNAIRRVLRRHQQFHLTPPPRLRKRREQRSSPSIPAAYDNAA